MYTLFPSPWNSNIFSLISETDDFLFRIKENISECMKNKLINYENDQNDLGYKNLLENRYFPKFVNESFKTYKSGYSENINALNNDAENSHKISSLNQITCEKNDITLNELKEDMKYAIQILENEYNTKKLKNYSNKSINTEEKIPDINILNTKNINELSNIKNVIDKNNKLMAKIINENRNIKDILNSNANNEISRSLNINNIKKCDEMIKELSSEMKINSKKLEIIETELKKNLNVLKDQQSNISIYDKNISTHIFDVHSKYIYNNDFIDENGINTYTNEHLYIQNENDFITDNWKKICPHTDVEFKLIKDKCFNIEDKIHRINDSNYVYQEKNQYLDSLMNFELLNYSDINLDKNDFQDSLSNESYSYDTNISISE